jgi:phosphatidylglycerophosphatase A
MPEATASDDAARSAPLARWIATAGGAGYAPIAPGTCGSAVGVALFIPLSFLAPAAFAIAVGALLAIGVWASDAAERAFGRKDDGRIVIDEVVGQLLTLAPLLVVSGGPLAAPIWLGVGFLLFRVFDIVKPGPVRWAERHFPGGAGVMLDDVAAGVLAALALAPARVAWDHFAGAPA